MSDDARVERRPTIDKDLCVSTVPELLDALIASLPEKRTSTFDTGSINIGVVGFEQLRRDLIALRDGTVSNVARREDCRTARPVRGWCDMCAAGHYERCGYVEPPVGARHAPGCAALTGSKHCTCAMENGEQPKMARPPEGWIPVAAGLPDVGQLIAIKYGPDSEVYDAFRYSGPPDFSHWMPLPGDTVSEERPHG